ncbi:uncharacterized protein LOC110029833 [Phalaenopsis equestris]|uniref:uncharacterized protein LOC110029833 n=1 Tax=Phalaenopsis equestris TaxID=78828 RepID=UPI0009E4822B|nr:uncharacterized protein LOC110029833 [Phalaenopsis equestris]
MSWFARSLVNSLRGDDDQSSEHNPFTKPRNDDKSGDLVHTDDQPPSPSRGVKEDLSELTKTITRQFWGVASFLAPPPDVQPPDPSRVSDPSNPAVAGGSDDSELSNSPRIAGIRSDFAELGGRFKSGISILSNTKAVSEISKIASTFLPFGDDGPEEEEEPVGEAVGLTEEVLLFVRNISLHPETWLDFPLIAEDEDPDEFEMSDAQQEHALAVERLEPALTALRIELCPSHLSEGCFWKIYFVLLHSRLNKHDAELLSTPQIVRARAMLLQDLHSRTKPNTNGSTSLSSLKEDEQREPTSPSEGRAGVMPSTPPQAEDIFVSIPVVDISTEKHPVESTEAKIIDKSVIEEDSPVQSMSKDLAEVSTISKQKDESNEDDWLEDESAEASGPGENAAPLGQDEDVSFSDLEEDDDHGIGAETKAISKSTPTQVKEPRGWVQLNKSNQNKDDWLNVDEVDAE